MDSTTITFDVVDFYPNDGQIDFLNLNPAFPQAMIKVTPESARQAFLINRRAVVSHRKYRNCVIVAVPYDVKIPLGEVPFKVTSLKNIGIKNFVYSEAPLETRSSDPTLEDKSEEELLQKLGELHLRKRDLEKQGKAIDREMERISLVLSEKD
jgi:hypothetical protein